MFSVARALEAVAAHRTRSAGPIGIDLGADVIHACQFRPRGGHRFEVLAAASIPFTGGRTALLESPGQVL